MTEVLVGTKKGLFALEGDPGGTFEITARAFAGEPAGEWEQAAGLELPAGQDRALERVWVITAGAEDGTLYAGCDPGCLFESRDGGATWALNEALWEHNVRESWQPGGGGLCLHSI